ncbi:MAG: hypothetical protein HC819_04115 [Cyclobacteriaceae bacterium]|nr:hypothetical protein [Cyclobacteriaceae bacterium]
MITNESGVTYHYSIPVYTYDEYIKSRSIDRKQGEVTNERQHPQPYAYTWLLTAITGPDYVNRNTTKDGTIGEDDWGYWVEFDYGMWANNYRWRNPESEWHKDIDENIQTYSRGKKEVYYLDAIKTRTHTALFIKEMREDGKGVSAFGDNASFIPKIEKDFKNVSLFLSYNNEYIAFPTASLKLQSIMLLSTNSFKEHGVNLTDLKARSAEYSQSFHYNNVYRNGDLLDPNDPIISQLGFISDFVIHTGEKILDVFDLDQLSSVLTTESLRSINFDYSYDLCPGTSNSFSDEDLYTINPNLSDRKKSGKLTLNAIQFLGKEGGAVIPKMNFGYEEENPKTGYLTLVHINTEENGSVLINATMGLDTNFEEGEIIKFNIDGEEYFGVITFIEMVGNSNCAVLNLLGQNIPALTSKRIICRTTKTPPYNQEYIDAWGFYKSDYEELGNSSINKYVSKVSKKSVDVWSLRNIETCTGVKIGINYESDKYLKPILAKNQILKIKAFDELVDNEFKISFIETNIGLDNIFKLNELVDCSTWGFYYFENALVKCANEGDCVWDQSMHFRYLRAFFSFKGSGKIIVIGSDYIIIESDQLKSELERKKTKKIEYIYGLNCNNIMNSRRAKICELTFSGTYDFFLGGFVSSGYNENGIFGGGIRVNSIKIQDGLDIRRTNYQYHINEKSTGYTNFEPFDILSPHIIVPDGTQPTDALIKSFKNALIQSYSSVIINSRELPSPMVIYQQVKVEKEIQKYGSETVKTPESRIYEFQVYEKT